ncbi:AMP-dependent synthetase/ligase [Flavobacterium sp. NRK F10]|uniref:AMP-dependent synthetase/ligase n=1 Tax=Flavobacterium sp. NRK F10 TaxID=2954931 RepID=UPI002091B975|nr:long-chain fatty acid--CoA ligase [Flavobacterium sp. NRK F10]MCO6173486.1 AMP-dependent synthetase/ligase [Flavobacterium sp. NRK F10]
MNKITRIFDFPYYQLEKYNLNDAFVTKVAGNWIKTSTAEYIEKANAISRALLDLGIKKGSKIALISSNNRTEWNIMDIGISQIGAVSVPIYPTISLEEFDYIFNHSEAELCFVSDEVLFQKLNSIKDKLPFVKDIYSFDSVQGCKNWEELVNLGKNSSNQDKVEEAKNNVSTKDLVTIIYTSGTTGKPKGVMLSHENLVSDALGSFKRVPLKLGESRAMSFLPICHVFERVLTYIYQYSGIAIYYAESIDKIADNIKEVKPNVMTVVPRLLEKVYDKITEKGAELGGIKKALFFWAVKIGEQYEPYRKNGWLYELKLAIANKLVLSKWKEGLGGNLEIIVSGSAPLQHRLIRVFTASKMIVMEGYGLTETSPVIAVNDMRNGGFKIGTVGKPLDNIEVKIAADGEILCKGPIVMMGYYKDEAKTAEMIKDGYFHTEDIGEIDSEGFLKITDRKKEMFKTSGGKYVAPQVLENDFKQSRFIEQIMVIGEGQKMPAAFIQLDFEFVKNWAERKQIQIGNTNAEIAQNPQVIARVQKVLDSINPKFGKWEQIKKFELTPDIWTIEGGQLTPTLKLKRKQILAQYKELYDKIYSN